MNITLPHNELEPEGHYYVFGIVLVLSLFVLVVYTCVVRWWWIKAARKRHW